MFATNVRGTFLMSQARDAAAAGEPPGAIVNVASVAGLVGVPNRAAYCASKGAVLALTRAMAIDHVGEGVRVNALCPGTTQTPWIERLVAEQGEKLEDLEAASPSAAWARPRRWRTGRSISRAPSRRSSRARSSWSTAG